MKGKPIQGFEEDYYITENGDIIDLQTGKLKTYYVRGNDIKPRVDLYKEGTLELSMYVEDILTIHFFGKIVKGYYTLKYKDDDVTNLCLSNFEIGTRNRVVKNRYVKKIPAKGTTEYHQRKMKQIEEEYIKSKVKQLEEMSIRDGVKCTVTYEDLKGRLSQLNYTCEISRVPLTFERKKDNTISVKRIGGRYMDITLDNIIVKAKRVFF
jgi:hypothetical protein